MGTCRGINVSTYQGERDWAGQRQTGIEAAETARKKGAYDGQCAVNFDPAVASALTGYTLPLETEGVS